MKKTLAAVLLFACAGALLAQGPADKAKPAPAPEKKPAPAAQPATAAEKKPAPAAKQPAKQAEEPEESIVMIDDKAEPDHGKAGALDADEPQAGPPGIPTSYGQCKGVTTDAGRTILVFENPDSGDISLVQLVFGKAGVSWRLLDTIRRQGAEVVLGGDAE